MTFLHILPWAVAAVAVVVAVKAICASRRKTTNLTLLLEALENDDTSVRFPRRKAVNRILNRITAILSDARIRIEQQERYYELILNFVETGIIVIDSKGFVRLCNTYALKMLGLPVLTHTSQLAKVAPTLPDTVNHARPGERLSIGPELSITLQVSSLRIADKDLRVFSLTDISRELGARESEAWSQLSRTLAHEIMNSLAPVISLSDTLLTLPPDCDEERREGLEAIGCTGRSLMRFVEDYRQLTRVPEPKAAPFRVAAMLSKISTLMPQVTFSCESGFTLTADEGLISQVIINLCTNAVQAGAKSIRITAAANAIEVANDGEPIDPDSASAIFTPFFTTRPEGSGIGLSLSRQIMARSGGTLKLISASAPVTFRLSFN